MAVAQFNDGFGNSICQKFAVFRIARFTAFGAITQKSTFHQDGGILRQAQDAKTCEVHAAVSRVWNRQQVTLDTLGQVA
jgi:hypothetical protein